MIADFFCKNVIGSSHIILCNSGMEDVSLCPKITFTDVCLLRKECLPVCCICGSLYITQIRIKIYLAKRSKYRKPGITLGKNCPLQFYRVF